MTSWYSAMIVYGSVVEGPPDSSPIRETSIRIFRAESEAAAWNRAEEIGRHNEHSYKNDEGQLVAWRFVEVADVQELCEEELTDGMEVFSCMLTLESLASS